jgi:Sulfotransferase domain
MPELVTRLPARRAELTAWPAGSNGSFLVRNRQSGDTFQLGEPEHFLLGRLDGRHSAVEVCSSFAERFGQPLSADELADFLTLAEQRGLLQSEAADQRLATDGFEKASPPTRPAGGLSRLRRVAGRLLAALSAPLQGLAGFLQGAAQKLRWLRLKHFEYVPRPDDIFIVTYPRSGTTWMQMILYQLTTDGGLDFPHIAEYCPWFERSVRSAQGFELRPSPRLFKSHLPYAKIPKGPGKYIYVARDGKDVALSYYHLYRQYNGYEGTFSEFFERFLRGKVEFGSWFEHVRGWWAQRDNPHVLLLTYEQLSSDLASCVRQIAAFIGRELPPERLPTIVERSSFAFMKAHEQKFDPALEILWEQGVQLKMFLRRGKAGEGAVALSDEQRAHFQRAFRDQFAALGMPFNLDSLPDPKLSEQAACWPTNVKSC